MRTADLTGALLDYWTARAVVRAAFGDEVEDLPCV